MMLLLLKAQVPPFGGFFALYKLIILFVLFVAWLMCCRWVDLDGQRLKMSRSGWNMIVFGSGALGVVLVLLMPIYWLGLVMFLVLAGGSLIAYVIHRNADLEPQYKVLTAEHLRRVLTREKAEEPTAEASVTITTLEGRLVKPPTEPTEMAVFNIVQQMFFEALQRRMDRMELVPADGQRAALRYSTDGIWSDAKAIDRSVAEKVIAYLKSIADMDPSEKRKPQQGKLIIGTAGTQMTVILHSSGSTAGERLSVKRYIDLSEMAVEKLGFARESLEVLTELLKKDAGIIIASGPAHSGVTTTLYSFLHTHDAYLKNIHTVEHQPLQELDGVTQHVLSGRPAAARPISEELQAVLRQDPDVMLVEPCEDETTATLCTQAAANGKKMYVGLRASDSFGALRKWLTMVKNNERVATTLLAVVNQRLIRKLCPACREAYKPNPESLRKANIPAEKVEFFYRPPRRPPVDKHGNPIICPSCGGSGYVGRTGVFETLIVDADVASLIRQGAELNTIKTHCRKMRMYNLQEQALRKVMAGITSINEVLRISKT